MYLSYNVVLLAILAIVLFTSIARNNVNCCHVFHQVYNVKKHLTINLLHYSTLYIHLLTTTTTTTIPKKELIPFFSHQEHHVRERYTPNYRAEKDRH